MAIGAEGHEILQAVVTQLAAVLPMMHLEVVHGPALLAAPVIPVQHPPQQATVGSLAELDTLDLLQDGGSLSAQTELELFDRAEGNAVGLA